MKMRMRHVDSEVEDRLLKMEGTMEHHLHLNRNDQMSVDLMLECVLVEEIEVEGLRKMKAVAILVGLKRS